MNLLAHSYLSFSDGQIVGNMIADYVRNADREKLPVEVQKGIIIHREIDTYTDQHTITHKAKKVFQPLVRLYAGAFVDVSMDYFLANDEVIHDETDWKKHTKHVYNTLWNYEEILPERFLHILPKMEADDWLFNYRYDWGIKYSLQNVLNKARYLEKDIPVFNSFMEEKDFLKECYDEFFPDLKNHIKNLKV
ncbi:acyl carrier protein phosphodiesterase [Elizabethkingia anophelis]|uniref:ACP phosphodiesterase n=1 Tax=Elizabethkingia anophelis TaxID=1117645 RepID=X5KLQ5_9FLAO|nr:ACP phosphodiesterase [Elizabethkingia anophelis]AQW93434.1 ACP phosphodiesterase [Elizabethkingia anophelis]AQX01825.1 ACP phosphodiesterase [Elizabethkingia anophelis]AQX50421.1 ACP phosphodiesterase [Elizabethkingia anophelis]EQB92761.1 ACP phosphodiesterase [Elizabethkingia anophelis 502]KFC33474.1 ACP phosphodiesterase [Elizabethkingia anophelis]